MTLPPPEVDRTREVLQETRKVFVRFLESPQSFLISNQSLQVLVEGFTARLDEAVVDRQELSATQVAGASSRSEGASLETDLALHPN